MYLQDAMETRSTPVNVLWENQTPVVVRLMSWIVSVFVSCLEIAKLSDEVYWSAPYV